MWDSHLSSGCMALQTKRDEHAVAQRGTRSSSKNVFEMVSFALQFLKIKKRKNPVFRIKHMIRMCYLKIIKTTYKKWETHRVSVSPHGTGTQKKVVTHIEVALSLGCCLVLNYIESLSVILASESGWQRASENNLHTGNLHKARAVQGLPLQDMWSDMKARLEDGLWQLGCFSQSQVKALLK